MMSTEDGMRKAVEDLDEAAGAAPTTDTAFGDKREKDKRDKKEHSHEGARDREDDARPADDE